MSTVMVPERMESTKEMNGEPINFRCSGMHKFCLTMIAGSKGLLSRFFLFLMLRLFSEKVLIKYTNVSAKKGVRFTANLLLKLS